MPHASKFVLALAFDRMMIVPILKIRLDMFKITIDGKILVLTVNRYKVSNHQIYCRKNMCVFKNMIEVNLKSKESQLHFHCLFLSTPSFENEKQISFYQLLFIAIKFYIGSP